MSQNHKRVDFVWLRLLYAPQWLLFVYDNQADSLKANHWDKNNENQTWKLFCCCFSVALLWFCLVSTCNRLVFQINAQFRFLIWTYHRDQWWPVPPSFPPGPWGWTLGWVRSRQGWYQPTDTELAKCRSFARKTPQTAVWWLPLWCRDQCWRHWSYVSGWRSFRDSLHRRQPSKRQK